MLFLFEKKKKMYLYLKIQKMKYKVLIISILTLVAFSCKKEEEKCADSPLSCTSLEIEYQCGDTRYLMDIDLQDRHIVIDNQADFDSLVTGACKPIIDFTTYDLVIGKIKLENGNNSITYEYGFNCENNNMRLTATLNQSTSSAKPNLTYHALIPKPISGKVVDVLLNLEY